MNGNRMNGKGMNREDYRKRPPMISTMQANSILTDYYKRLVRAKKEGKPVAWVGLEIPSQLFYVFDVVPVYPQYMVALQSMTGDYTGMAEDLEGKWELPRDMCSEVKATIGNVLHPPKTSLSIPLPDFLVTHNGVCLQMSKGFDFLSAYLNIPHYFIDMPRTYHDSCEERYHDYIKSQLKSALLDIVKTHKRKLNMKKLHALGKNSLRIMLIWKEILKLCRQMPSPVDGQDLVGLFLPFLIADSAEDDGKTTNMYVSLYNELYKRIEEERAAGKEREKYRILWDVLTIYRNKNFIKNSLAKFGASVVMTTLDFTEDIVSVQTEKPLFGYPLSLSKIEESDAERNLLHELMGIEAIEDMGRMDAFDMMVRLFSFFVRKETTLRFERMKRFILSYHIDAVIMHMNQNCRTNSLSQTLLKESITNELGLPVLIFHSDSMDDRYFSKAQIATRLEAFFENLDKRANGES